MESNRFSLRMRQNMTSLLLVVVCLLHCGRDKVLLFFEKELPAVRLHPVSQKISKFVSCYLNLAEGVFWIDASILGYSDIAADKHNLWFKSRVPLIDYFMSKTLFMISIPCHRMVPTVKGSFGQEVCISWARRVANSPMVLRIS